MAIGVHRRVGRLISTATTKLACWLSTMSPPRNPALALFLISPGSPHRLWTTNHVLRTLSNEIKLSELQ
ncbi:hypothetical protein LshimejAT787_0705240 [Lyophyllum shimeji]|uniref:Uncharacterized protein n=1 Tax=Lyophyllum shimeji TaxID=47721 RepID=A0A9P3UM43_LYOSH|nr:hypothetical protein LshimejAT787_0705240 [Lyophyllum shimeji]